MNGAVDEMIAGGMSARDAMDSAGIQTQIAQYGLAVQDATRLQMMASGLQKQQAKQQLGYAQLKDDEMTAVQRNEVADEGKELL